jgi:hypothetical protein
MANFCTECGEALPTRSKFCGNCGEKVLEGQVLSLAPENKPAGSLLSKGVDPLVNSLSSLVAKPLQNGSPVSTTLIGATPFADLEAEMTPELSVIFSEITAAMSSEQGPHFPSELYERALEIDRRNTQRLMAILFNTLDSMLDGMGSDELLVHLGLDLYACGDEEAALSMWEKAAEDGNGDALVYLYVIARDFQNNAAMNRIEAQIRLSEHPTGLWEVALVHLKRGEVESFHELRQLAVAAGNPDAIHHFGDELIKAGQLEEGLEIIEPIARSGNASILSTYIWSLVLSEQHARAKEFGLEALPVAEQFVDNFEGSEEELSSHSYQLANARSNHALASMALGESPSTFVEMWREGSHTGHEESLFYPLVSMWAQGQNSEAIQGFNALPLEVRESAANTVSDLCASCGWVSEWGSLGQELIDAADSAEQS